MERCAPTVKRLSLELGGNEPFIVFDHADVEGAVKGAFDSKFRASGQTCVCANRILVQSAVHDEFVERLTSATNDLVVGDGFEPGVAQGLLINDAAVAKVERHIADAVDRGATIVASGEGHELGGTFFQPTVLAGARPDMLIAEQETFGPVAVFRFDREEEAIELANATEFGLAAYIFSPQLRSDLESRRSARVRDRCRQHRAVLVRSGALRWRQAIRPGPGRLTPWTGRVPRAQVRVSRRARRPPRSDDISSAHPRHG